ncbi:MAG: phage major capsid protein [Actinomycetota bacterium]|nr:phage major capsid protein [Actinomycetota bacterium]
MLEDQLKDLQKAIEAKKAEKSAAWTDFAAKRDALKAEGVDITNPEDPAVKAADEAMKPYSKASDELASLQGQFERIALMAADGGERTVNSRTENEHDRHPAEARESLGQMVAASELYQEALKSGAFERDGLKAQLSEPMDRGRFAALLTGTSDPAGGVLNVPERFPGVVDLPRLPLGILDLITVGETDSNAVEFIRLLARTINAAEVAEASSSADIGDGTGGTTTAALGGVKPESGLTFEEVVEAVKTIAHWIPATRNTLSDTAFLRTLIDSEMTTGVTRRAEIQIAQGNGTSPNIRGILNTVGIASYTQGTAPNAGEPRADAIHRKFTLLRLAGFEPTGEAIHPSDWQEIRLSKDANENYIWGPPSLAGQMQVWGTPVVSTIAVPQGTSLGGEWARALFLIREAVKILVSDSHKDWFTRNIVAILAEMRGVLVVPRPQAFGKTVFA